MQPAIAVRELTKTTLKALQECLRCAAWTSMCIPANW